MSGSLLPDYLRLSGGRDCRFTGDIERLQAVGRAVAAIGMQHMCGTPPGNTGTDIVINGVTWVGVKCFGKYLLLQQQDKHESYMLTEPYAGKDHHCRTVQFEVHADTEDGEGVTEARQELQQAAAINEMLYAAV
jgi:hypothetical protein